MDTEDFTISLPSDLAALVQDHIDRGAYNSVSDVIRDALRCWRDREQERAHQLESIRERINRAAENPGRIADDDLGRHFDRLLVEARTRKAS